MTECVINKRAKLMAQEIVSKAREEITFDNKKKLNLIWVEANGCSGNIISFLNADSPSATYFLTEVVNLKYTNSLMLAQGEKAILELNEAMKEEYALIIDGAIATKDNGVYTFTGNLDGKLINNMEEVRMTAEKAKYILAVGNCASFGGISAAAPNPSGSISAQEFLKDKKVINLPGCPCHPDWLMGTVANLILFGEPELDNYNRPLLFYSNTIHDFCERRSFFNNGIFSKSVGEQGCMFKIGCRGPVTRVDCPMRKWNERVSWPVEDNTPCIGCAQLGFPDLMEPFVAMD